MKWTIEHLKSLGTPHYFGLGFIQLKINDSERMHFYHPEIMPILDADEIHDHRYEFHSTVLKGELRNEIFTYSPLAFAEHGLFEVSCKKEDAGKIPHLIKEVVPEFLSDFTVSDGQTYSLSSTVFHRIHYNRPTITNLKRGPVVKDYARIIKPIDAPAICPFSKVMNEDEIWSIIKSILDS